MTKKNDFVHLHVHTEYSLLDGLSKIKPLVARAKELGMKSLAITDHGGMYGVVKFYNACREAGIKPIIGVEAYITAGSRFDKSGGRPSGYNHLLLLAKNFQGYRNLLKLVSASYLEGFYYKPRIDWELLEKYHQGLIAGSACLKGIIPSLIVKGQKEKARQEAKRMVELFGDDFYLEIQSHPGINDQAVANKGVVELSRELGIPLLATNDSHYIYPEDAEGQDALLAIQTQSKLTDKNRLSLMHSPDLYIKTPDEMWHELGQYPDALRNTLKVAEKCNLEIPLGQKIYPRFSLPPKETAASYLRKLVLQRLPARYPQADKRIKDRVDYELSIIIDKGYAEYFLIVQDLVNWSKNQGIRVGPGRGSAAGSIVSYILRITSIDPLLHHLPFERFLNPERESTPDIDLDFPDSRRDEVITYVRRKYGEDHVAQIITFGTIEARMAVRDVARVLGYPYAVGDRIAKMIPFVPGHKISLDDAVKENPELKRAYEEEEMTRKVINLAKKIVGTVRHASVHAAGVVISDKPLVDYTPLQRDTKEGKITTQYDMYSLDLNVADRAVGLLKMDFLGLRNLTIIEEAANFIKQTKNKDIDLSGIPLDDKRVYGMITRGETTGVFQLESQGMRKLAQKLQPARFSDLSAMVALFRPGPMQFIDDFIAGKRDFNKIHYPHPDLKPVLEETYGIAVYQEQVMEIPHVMASYTLGEADLLRRAIGKKKIELMHKEKKRFIERSVKNGYSRQISEDVFALIERFASYGFNKAHSVSYAMITYQTAWLKANYPVEFMAALLTAEAHSGQGHEEKIFRAIQGCRRMGIKVLPPDINYSQTGFSLEKDKDSPYGLAIRFGLSAIKNVGEAAIEEIVKSRKKKGDFNSLEDFYYRVDNQKVNKKVLESLVKVGAFDHFGERKALLTLLDRVRNAIDRLKKDKLNGQASLFDSKQGQDDGDVKLPHFEVNQSEKISNEEKLNFEKELLGFYLSGHPLGNKLAKYASLASHQIEKVLSEEGSLRVRLVGAIDNLRLVTTKKSGRAMAFANLRDETSVVDLVIFPDLYDRRMQILNAGVVVVVEGRSDHREGKVSVVAEEISLPENFSVGEKKPGGGSGQLILHIPPHFSPSRLMALNEILQQHPGQKHLVLAFANGKVIVPKQGIDFTPAVERKLSELLGEQ